VRPGWTTSSSPPPAAGWPPTATRPRRISRRPRGEGTFRLGDEEAPSGAALISAPGDRRGPLFPRRARAAELPGLRQRETNDIAYYPARARSPCAFGVIGRLEPANYWTARPEPAARPPRTAGRGAGAAPRSRMRAMKNVHGRRRPPPSLEPRSWPHHIGKEDRRDPLRQARVPETRQLGQGPIAGT